MFSIRIKLLFLLLPITLALLGGLGYYNFLESTAMTVRSAQAELQAVVRAKQGRSPSVISATVE